jgi:endonuclease YncB( thermonuclease family)
MRMVGRSANYVLHVQGQPPDTAKALPYDQAVPQFIKGVEKDSSVQLLDMATQFTYTSADAEAVKLAYCSQLPTHALVVRSHGGKTFPVADLRSTLDSLIRTRAGGVYAPKDDLWLVRPPEENPDFERQVAELGLWLEDVKGCGAAVHPEAQPRERAESYPMETRETGMELLPGLSGDRALEVIVGFLQHRTPVTLAALGAMAGMVAYKSMGLKGVIGLLLAVAALKRYLMRGHRIILDRRLDLVARGLQEGIPVDKEGVIDPDFLEALRRYPAGDHKVTLRQIEPAVAARQWENHRIKVDPASHVLESLTETILQVVDGDTIVGSKGRYRLIGIDTPELNHDGSSERQPGAQQAWERLRQLVPPGGQVRLEIAKNQPALYGRLPCYLYAKDERGEEICMNRVLLEEGLARVTNFQPYHPKMQDFVEAGLRAIANRAGLWNAIHNPRPAPPLFAIDAERARCSDGSEQIRLAIG